jgi:hypothetical protein
MEAASRRDRGPDKTGKTMVRPQWEMPVYKKNLKVFAE